MKVLFAAFALSLACPAMATTDNPTNMIPKVSEGRVVAWPALDGGAAGRMTVWVWLPPGYDASKGTRYPVLYMHDGQNLFDRALTGYDQEWGIDEAIPRMVRRGDLRSWIVVGVQNPKARYHGLFPAKILPLLPADFRQRVETLEGKERLPFTSAAYLDFLVNKVKARVDRSFRTLRGRDDTAVMGSSMGGLMSFYAMAEYPEVFGQAACVSMHLALGDPTNKALDHKVAAKAAAEAFRQYLRTSRMRPGVNRLYIDHGSGTLDGSYGPYSDAVVPVLRAVGWKDGPSFEFRTYAGTEHNETAWRQRVDIPLAFLDRRDP